MRELPYPEDTAKILGIEDTAEAEPDPTPSAPMKYDEMVKIHQWDLAMACLALRSMRMQQERRRQLPKVFDNWVSEVLGADPGGSEHYLRLALDRLVPAARRAGLGAPYIDEG